MKRGIILAIMALLLCTLTGCIDAMPDMTQAETDMIAEYSASLLLKHSSNYPTRLVDDEELERALFEEAKEQMGEIEEEVQEEEQQEETQAEGGTSEGSSSSETISVEVTVENTVPDARDVDLAEIVGMSGISIQYFSYELTDTYPKESTGFDVSAAKGNTLLILNFAITNLSGEALVCDMLQANPDIRVNVNDKGFKKVENTLLMNDITTYYEELAKDSSAGVVAIFETDQKIIESLSIKVDSTELFIE